MFSNIRCKTLYSVFLVLLIGLVTGLCSLWMVGNSNISGSAPIHTYSIGIIFLGVVLIAVSIILCMFSNVEYGTCVLISSIPILGQLRVHLNLTFDWFIVTPFLFTSVTLIFIAYFIRMKRLKLIYIDKLLIFFAIICIPSVILNTKYFDLALAGYVSSIITSFIFYFLIRLTITDGKKFKNFLISIAVMFGVVVCYMGVEMLRGGGLYMFRATATRTWQQYGLHARFSGGLGEPVNLAETGAILGPILMLSYFTFSGKKKKVFLYTGLIFSLFPFVLGARAATVRLCITLFFILYLLRKYQPKILKKILGKLVILSIIFLIATFTIGKVMYERTTGYSTSVYIEEAPFDLKVDGNIVLRFVGSNMSIKAFLKNPLGTGDFYGEKTHSSYFSDRLMGYENFYFPHLNIGNHYGWLALAVWLFFVYKCIGCRKFISKGKYALTGVALMAVILASFFPFTGGMLGPWSYWPAQEGVKLRFLQIPGPASFPGVISMMIYAAAVSLYSIINNESLITQHH